MHTWKPRCDASTAPVIFSETVRLAANLADDADTVATLTRQMPGAFGPQFDTGPLARPTRLVRGDRAEEPFVARLV